MDYWHETMQDDVYLIVAEGWQEAAKPRAIIKDKSRNIEESPDLTVGKKKYKTDLIPPELIVARYFARKQQNIDELVSNHEAAARELEEYTEEHGGEEGLLSDAQNDKGTLTKKGVTDRLKEIRRDSESGDERATLEHALSLIEAESAASKAVKDAQAELDAAVLAKYGTLSEDDIRVLVVEDKWYASIAAAIDDEVQRVTGRLAARVKELEERYANPLPESEKEVEEYSRRVEAHLEKMGVAWS
ncbi:MAG: type I restriction endonuclease subunit M, partial [Spirochaetes bacterium]|jgi:type I restriction enzyme M protein|nr:type I restriction endonuclease subunit M [Spirochaetota bacterium]